MEQLRPALCLTRVGAMEQGHKDTHRADTAQLQIHPFPWTHAGARWDDNTDPQKSKALTRGAVLALCDHLPHTFLSLIMLYSIEEFS